MRFLLKLPVLHFQIFRIAGVIRIIVDCIGNRAISVNLLECDFPLVMAFDTSEGDHRDKARLLILVAERCGLLAAVDYADISADS